MTTSLESGDLVDSCDPMPKSEFSIDIGWLNNLIEHIQEPLFAIAVIGFLLTVLRPIFIGGIIYDSIPYIMILLLLGSIYFLQIYFKGNTKNYWFIGIPMLLAITTLFTFFVDRYTGSSISRDYLVYSIVAGLFLLFYTISVHKLLDIYTSILYAIFFSMLLTHMMPALAPYLAEIDPYYNYKIIQLTYNKEHVPEHDYLTYPLWGGLQRTNLTKTPGTDISAGVFFSSVVIASTEYLVSPFNISLYDNAMITPGIFGVFAILFVYILVENLFYDMKPYNRIAALLAAFMLTFSPAFSAHSVATNTEDDGFGMPLVVASLMLLAISLRKKSLIYSLLAGLSFVMLSMTWGGYNYASMIVGLFGISYAIISFINRKSCIEHLPYIIIALFPSLLAPTIFLHHRGAFSINLPSDTALLPFGGTILVSIILELIRSYKFGAIKYENKIDALIQKNIYPLSILIILSSILFIFVKGYSNIIDIIVLTLKQVKQNSLIFYTIAEQNPFCTGFNECLVSGYYRFGLAFWYGLIMIPILLYFAVKNRNLGATLVLCWSVPMIWGLPNKSQYIFNSSVPIAVLGSTIGLFSLANKKDLESIRVIFGILILAVPFMYVPIFGAELMDYNKFVGTVPMYMGPSGDNYFWYPALEWMRDYTKEGTAFITWWDYGHWITSISHRDVIIDNLQADHYEIQDVARFFLNITDEDKAFETIKAYEKRYKELGKDLKYAVIDWTMIGKGSALHFIATGTIDPFVPGDFSNYIQCGFLQQSSTLTPRVVTDEDGKISRLRRIVFGCGWPNVHNIKGIIFDLKEDQLSGINVIDGYSNIIPWATWIKNHDASILGVQPLIGNYTQPGILQLAVQRPNEPIYPSYRSLIYVPNEFQDYMMTKLYLGDFIEEYKALGLYNRDAKRPKHFRLVQDFSGGFVRVYEILYDGTYTNESITGGIL